MKRLVTGAVVAFVLCSITAPALAQQTGGSFGGGDFGSSSSSGSSDEGSSSSGGSWGGSSSDSWSAGSGNYVGGHGGGCFSGLGGLCLLLVIIGGITAFNKFSRRGGAGNMAAWQQAVGAGGGMPIPVSTGNAMHTTSLVLGIDWRARKQLQEQLARMAASGQTGTKEGRAALLRETVLALRRAEISWLYVGYRDAGAMAPQGAEQTFHQLGNDARARFRQELVRNADGSPIQQQAAPAMRANANEGQGTVVVTLIIVAHRQLRGIQNPQDANEIRWALDDRGSLTADQLVALEVVWSPAAENDRMSTAELEQFYPDMRLIDPNSIAGRVFCQFCTGPFPMELLNCPHCGAPAPKQPGQA